MPSNNDHIGEKGLWVLKQKNCVYGLNGCSLEFFLLLALHIWKYNHFQFYYSSHKSSGLLNLFRYLFGLVKVSSISMDLYYVSFIEDYSRRT